MRTKLASAAACLLALVLTAALMWGRLTAPTPSSAPPAVASVSSSSVARVKAPAPPAVSAAPSAEPSASRPPPIHVAVDPLSERLCPADMVLARGYFCPFVAHRCQQYVGAPPAGGKRRKAADRRCRRYRDDLLCEGRPSQLRFCIDRYEYPNLPGSKPVVLVDYRQAREACAVEGKRQRPPDRAIVPCAVLGLQDSPGTTTS